MEMSLDFVDLPWLLLTIHSSWVNILQPPTDVQVAGLHGEGKETKHVGRHREGHQQVGATFARQIIVIIITFLHSTLH